MMGVNYYSNQAAYLAGVLGAKMLESGDAKIDPSKKVLGFVGSMDTANINDFLVGYLEGVKYVDPEIKVMTSYVGSFEDVSKCMEMTTQLYNQGAQVVYAPASQSILGAATAAQNADKYLIACDQDLYSELASPIRTWREYPFFQLKECRRVYLHRSGRMAEGRDEPGSGLYSWS